MAKKKGKRGKSAKNAKNTQSCQEPEEIIRAPHSFIINRGKLGKNANELMLNFRNIMEPYTASHLKAQRQNILKDFIHMAGPLNVSHMVIFTKSQIGMYVKIIKLPRGPTLTFKITNYSLARDIISSQKKSLVYEKLFLHHPLLVLNNFSGEGMHFKLMTTMFQNMFPSINVNKVNLNTIRRCVLLNYTNEKTIELRHYAIKVVPTGMSKAVKKLIQSKVPDLGHYQDISEFLQKSGNLSDSEVEMDTALNTVTLPQSISSRGNMTSQKSAIRLFEIGPRMSLQLMKIEEGTMTGEVLYHDFISRTPGEIKVLKDKIEAKKRLKAQRRLIQESNVKKKKEAKGELSEEDEADSEAEDLEWYQKEVGEKPDADFAFGIKRKRSKGNFIRPAKKAKTSAEGEKSETKITFQDFIEARKKKKLAKEKKKMKSKKRK